MLSWFRTNGYVPLRPANSGPPSKASSLWATSMSSYRMRTLISLAVIATMLIALLHITDMPAKIQNLTPQNVYDSFHDVPPLDLDKLGTQSSSSATSDHVTAIQTGIIEALGNGKKENKETNHESEVLAGKPTSLQQKPSQSTRLPVVTSPVEALSKINDIDWSVFAYVQYVTNSNYLCNSLMIFETLHRIGTKAERIMLYPQQWKVPKGKPEAEEERFLLQARDRYKVKLVPIQVVTYEDRGDETWKDSYTKLLAFNQTQYKRVISLDSDAIVKQVCLYYFLLYIHAKYRLCRRHVPYLHLLRRTWMSYSSFPPHQ